MNEKPPQIHGSPLLFWRFSAMMFFATMIVAGRSNEGTLQQGSDEREGTTGIF
jgi:hypothetical protein